MGWWTAAVGALQIGSGLLANNKARKAGRAAAALIREEGAESLRRMERTQQFRVGAFRAGVAASGLLLDKSSTGSALVQLEKEYQRQRDWFVRTNEQRARVARSSGNYVGLNNIVQGIGTIGASFYEPNPRVDPNAN